MRNIAGTQLVVSELCLGSMNFGEQVFKNDAFNLLDAATSKYGINFLVLYFNLTYRYSQLSVFHVVMPQDTAESYPMPSEPGTFGRSEKIIGSWMRSRKVQRENIVLASKVCGYSDEITWCRQGNATTRIIGEQLEEAVDGILRRLGTDYLDILYIHWPDRYVPLFGDPNYNPDLYYAEEHTVRSQLDALQRLIQSGKIRYFGLANETPYGVTSFLKASEYLSLPRACVLQNPYSLLVRNEVETGLQEIVHREKIGFVATSPLAGGALTGKYLTLSKEKLMECRMYKYPGFMQRYIAPPATAAVSAYLQFAEQEAFLPLLPLALSWVYSRPFVTSTVIGATSLSQLEENILALNIPMTDEFTEAFNKIYRSHQDPTKGVFEVYFPQFEEVDPATLPWGGRDEDIDPELDIIINQRLTNI